MVSILTFYSEDSSLNPAGNYLFVLDSGKAKINEKETGFGLFFNFIKTYDWCSMAVTLGIMRRS